MSTPDHPAPGKRRLKVTPAVRHLTGGRYFEQLAASQPTSPTAGLLPPRARMAFQATPKVPVSYETAASYIRAYIQPSMAFYIDTNFFTGEEKPAALWNSLLEREVVITPLVWKELQPWLERPFYNRRMRNIVLDARLSKNPAIRFVAEGENPFPSLPFYPYLYYINLLAVRRRMGQILVETFVSEHGREPTDEEFNRLVQSTGADHEFHLIRKGRTDITKDTFLADEQLVASAVIDALVHRRETTVLTTDNDVQAQFVKIANLLDCQYQAHLFAERFVADPSSFTVLPLHRTTPELQHYFAADGRLVLKPCEPGRAFVEWLLPPAISTTAVHCLLFGGAGDELRFSAVEYNAEDGMTRLLEVKATTSGLNTNLLGGENCHVTGFPVGIADPRKWVVIVRDNMVEEGIMACPLMDIAHANVDRRNA